MGSPRVPRRVAVVATTAVLAAFSVLLAWVASPAGAAARGFPAACAGTYLIEEDGGARDFWTFAADGTFFGTTSTQPLLNFSNQQGSWEATGPDGGRGVLFAFVWDDDNLLLTTARIDITFDAVGTEGPGCDRITGSLVVRGYEADEDPLEPSTDDDPEIASDTFVGRRVRVGGGGS